MFNFLEFNFKQIARVWTGDNNGKNTNEAPNGFLRESGILGSIRWWYEAVVRGYGGYACDPTSNTRCPDKKGNRCAVCEFFGCTDWSAKFRFLININNNNITMTFIPIKEIKDEEKFLLTKTLYIISEYGCIGGKTTFKPPMPNEINSNKSYHRDYGLIQLVNHNLKELRTFTKTKIEGYVKSFKVFDDNRGERQNEPEFPNINFFIFKKGEYLNQNQMTNILNQSPNWLKGHIGKSKFLFSFWTQGAKRWWCYSKADEYQYQELKGLLNTQGLIKGRNLL